MEASDGPNLLDVADRDGELPDLALVLGPESVQELAALWRAAGGAGQRSAVEASRHDTKYEPGVRCTVVWRLTGERDRAERVTFGVAQADPAGATFRLFQHDRGLPGLQAAADPTRVTVGGDHGAVRAIVPVRYQPGRSCVLRLDLEDGTSLFGKVSGEADALAATVKDLGAARGRGSGLPRVPRVLGELSDLQLVLFEHLGGEPLGKVIFARERAEDDRLEAVARAGAAVAALHTLPAPAGPARRLDHDLQELRGYLPVVSHFEPRAAAGIAEAIQRLSASAADSGTRAAPVASHGALRADQLLVDHDLDVAMLDLDGFCRSAPERDVANLLAYLDWRGIRIPADRSMAERARNAFLSGYASAGRAPDETTLARYRSVSLLKIAGRRYRSLGVREWWMVPELTDLARQLAGG